MPPSVLLVASRFTGTSEGNWGEADTYHVIRAGLRCMAASHQKETSKPHCKDKPHPDCSHPHKSGVWGVYTLRTQGFGTPTQFISNKHSKGALVCGCPQPSAWTWGLALLRRGGARNVRGLCFSFWLTQTRWTGSHVLTRVQRVWSTHTQQLFTCKCVVTWVHTGRRWMKMETSCFRPLPTCWLTISKSPFCLGFPGFETGRVMRPLPHTAGARY